MKGKWGCVFRNASCAFADLRFGLTVPLGPAHHALPCGLCALIFSDYSCRFMDRDSTLLLWHENGVCFVERASEDDLSFSFFRYHAFANENVSMLSLVKVCAYVCVLYLVDIFWTCFDFQCSIIYFTLKKISWSKHMVNCLYADLGECDTMGFVPPLRHSGITQRIFDCGSMY